jgi:hypothetical protein
LKRALRKGERLIIPCPDMLHSDYNGYDYCTLASGGSYCRPDVRVSGFKCPRGYPHHVWELKERREEEDINWKIETGRQATLEGF